MDFVPRRHRGKVNGLDSIRTFSWSGSAAVGGFLIERIGFRHTFLVTACIKAAAFLPLFPLLAYVPDGICLPPGSRAARLERMQRTHEEAASAAVSPPCEPMQREEAADDDSGLRQPLLQNGKGPDSPA
jgi:MFS family permease